MKHKLKGLYLRAKKWAQAHRKLSVALAAVVIIGLVFGITSLLTGSDENVVRTQAGVDAGEQNAKPQTITSPLTGLEVTPEAAARPVTAVVIENSPDARPQSSLNVAGFVFEAIAEGGITRFVAFYQETRPDPIGPVRSLRPYFSDITLAFDASIAHVGGSAEALKEVDKLGLKDLDQFANGEFYYRTTDRFAPHNVYTDFDKLDKLNKSLGFTKSEFDSFERKVPAPLPTPKARKISVPISSYLYQSDYVYSPSLNVYKRSIAGTPDKDRESKKQLAPSVVVVIESPYTVSADGRYHYDLIGKGKVTVFQDGDVTVGTWKRAKRDSQFVFTDDEGQTIAFNAGQVWMTVLDPSQEVKYTK